MRLFNQAVQGASNVVQNAKAASAVAAGTTGTGISTILEIIPADIGKIATLVGICLSLILIYTHLRKHRIEMILLERALQEGPKK